MRFYIPTAIFCLSFVFITYMDANAQGDFGLQAGFSSSSYRVDSARDIRGITWFSGGAYYQYRLQDKWHVHMAAQYSGRGADTELGDYRGQYIDLQLLPRFTHVGISYEAGLQYAIVISQSLTRMDKLYNTNRTDVSFQENTYKLNHFHNQAEAILGIHFNIQHNFSVGIRYSLPLVHMEYSNFQFALSYNLTATRPTEKTKDGVNDLSLDE